MKLKFWVAVIEWIVGHSIFWDIQEKMQFEKGMRR